MIDEEKRRLKAYIRREANDLHADLCGLYNSFGSCTCRVRLAWAVLKGIPEGRVNWPERDLR